MNNKSDIVRELASLYELSLSIGGSLSLKETSESFLKVWMRQKNIDYGSLWICDSMLHKEVTPHQYHLVYAHPIIFAHSQSLVFPAEFCKSLKENKVLKISSKDDDFQLITKSKVIQEGTYWLIPVPNVGFIKLFFQAQNPSGFLFCEKDIKKVEKVLSKLAYALKTCLLHQQVLDNIDQKTRYKKEIQKLALVAEKTENLIIITDPKGEIEWVNEAFEKVSGYTLAEVIGRKPGSFLQGKDTDKEIVQQISRHLKEQISFRYEILNYSKTGESYWVDVSIQPVFNENNELIHFVAVESDITKRKKEQEELHEAKEKAEEAGRVKQEFLSVVSHEIRTPLNAILGISTLLQKTNLTPVQLDYLNTIQVSTDNLQLIITSILDFSAIESGNLTIQQVPFDLVKLIENIINSNQLRAEEKGNGLFLDFDDRIHATLSGDAVRLGQVLLNLVSNAIKFTNHGKIRLEVKLLTKMQNALVIRFAVEDTGKGIPSSMQQKIFDSFTQEDSSISRKYGGTGLGLSISQKLVQLMGGEIKLVSEENKGTSVSFVLGFPITQDTIENLKRDTTSHHLLGKKVLLVEDNTMNQFFTQKLLEGWGMQVQIASNGLEGVKKAAIQPFDIILMDIQMPEMDGIQATKRIREDKKKVPIIALTAMSSKEEIVRLNGESFNDYVLKPFNANELQEKLEQHLFNPSSFSITSPQQQNQEIKEEKLYSNQLLVQMMHGQEEQVKQMEVLFVQQAKEALIDFSELIAKNDWKRIAQIAHKLKASIDMLQIEILKKTIRELENHEKMALDKTDKDRLVAEIKKALEKVCEQIEASHL